MLNQKQVSRIGVIGDLHSEHVRLERVLDWVAGERVDALICTGDVADGLGCINASCELLRDADVLTVAGNHDRWLLEDRVRHVNHAHRLEELTDDNVEYLLRLPQQRQLSTSHGELLLCHGVAGNDLARVWPGRKPEEIKRSPDLDRVLNEKRYRFLINGHMHFRVLLDFIGLTLLNAGTLQGPHAGVSILDLADELISTFSVADGPRPKRLLETPLHPGAERRVWRDTSEFDGAWPPVTLYAGN